MLDKMVNAFKEAHPDINSQESALKLWDEKYKGHFDTANEDAWHFTAFRMAFLDGETNGIY